MDNHAINKMFLDRLHPMWIPFSIARAIRSMILFAFLLIVYIGFSSNQTNQIIIVSIGILLFLYRCLLIILEWKHYKYAFTNKELVIHQGRFFSKKRYISLDKIQSVNQHNTLFHRLFKLTSISINTGANREESTVKLEMITYAQFNQIKESIQDTIVLTDNTDSPSKKDNEKNKIRSLSKSNIYNNFTYKVERKEIYLAALTSNQVLIFIGVLQALYFNIGEFYSVDIYLKTIVTWFQSSWITVLIGVLLFLFLSMIYGLAKTIIQYKHFSLTVDLKKIYIRKGFLSQNMYTIQKKRIQAIGINSSLIHKFLNIVEVKTFSANDESEIDDLSSNVLFPFIKRDKAISYLNEILPKYSVLNKMQRLPPTAILLKFIRSSRICIILFAVTYFLIPQYWYLYGSFLALIIITNTLCGYLNQYGRDEALIQFKRGAFETRLFATRKENIEEIKITQSFLQKRLKCASIKIATRANPIKFTVMADIPHTKAKEYYYWYMNDEKYVN